MDQIGTPLFWIALMKIIWVNILLSGDNAVVIALAARSLPEHQQKPAVILGSLAAIVLRVLLTIFAVQLLQYPYLKLIGAALLLWIGASLLKDDDDGEDGVKQADTLYAAVRTILIADLVMSLDNVIAVAAAAESGPPQAKLALLLIGLGLSIPLIIFGSTLLLHLMEKYPVIITVGAGLLGFVAGEMAVEDPAVAPWINANAQFLHWVAPVLGIVVVLVLGRWMNGRKPATG